MRGGVGGMNMIIQVVKVSQAGPERRNNCSPMALVISPPAPNLLKHGMKIDVFLICLRFIERLLLLRHNRAVIFQHTASLTTDFLT